MACFIAILIREEFVTVSTVDENDWDVNSNSENENLSLTEVMSHQISSFLEVSGFQINHVLCDIIFLQTCIVVVRKTTSYRTNWFSRVWRRR